MSRMAGSKASVKTIKFEPCVIASILVVGLLLGCDGGGRTPNDDPTPTAATPVAPAPTPAPTAAPTKVVKIVVPFVNPETGETVKLEVEFDQGASVGDDEKKEGKRGKVLISGGVDSPTIFPIDEDGRRHPAIGLGAVECERVYLILRYILEPTNADGCAPAVIATQFKRAKAEVIATAVGVVKECWKKGDCRARIVFQGSRRVCHRQDSTRKWFLTTEYQVKVICFRI